jgi:hypothetical protein
MFLIDSAGELDYWEFFYYFKFLLSVNGFSDNKYRGQETSPVGATDPVATWSQLRLIFLTRHIH